MSSATDDRTGASQGPSGDSLPRDSSDRPIPGPSLAGPEWIFEQDKDRPLSLTLRVARFMADLVRVPAFWVRENVVEANKGPKYYYYHRKYPRVLPIDECYIDDYPCIFEADLEFKRIHKVDRETLNLLRYRRDSCYFWYKTKKGGNILADQEGECKDAIDAYEREVTNFHIKYGDMHYSYTVLQAYNKQKHRMIVDRRRALKKEQQAQEEQKQTYSG